MNIETLNLLLSELKNNNKKELDLIEQRWRSRTEIYLMPPSVMDLAEQLAIERNILDND